MQTHIDNLTTIEELMNQTMVIEEELLQIRYNITNLVKKELTSLAIKIKPEEIVDKRKNTNIYMVQSIHNGQLYIGTMSELYKKCGIKDKSNFRKVLSKKRKTAEGFNKAPNTQLNKLALMSYNETY